MLTLTEILQIETSYPNFLLGKCPTSLTSSILEFQPPFLFVSTLPSSISLCTYPTFLFPYAANRASVVKSQENSI